MTQFTTVDLSIRDDIATITFCGAARHNAVGVPTYEALIRIGEELRTNARLRLVIVTGEGDKAFIGGGDIADMAAFTPVRSRASGTKMFQSNHVFRILPVPSIARINGYCLGAGMETAAACDMRVACDDARFGMPEVRLGMPSVAQTTLFAGLVGAGRAREICYRGHIFDAQAAYAMGFLNRVVPRDKLDSEGMQPIIDDILAAEPQAIRAQKRLLEGWIDQGVGAGTIASIDAFSAAYHTPAPQRRLQDYLARHGK
jgi:enoyl-CoA hydratase/carnithine racemase